MAWIYSVGSAESVSPSRRGCDQSPIVRSIDIASRCYSHGCTKERCRVLLSGTTCERSLRHAFQMWTLSRAVSRARTSVLQELEQAWRESEVDCFLKSCDWLASFDHNSFSWKMCQLSLFEDLSEFSWNSLRWGTIVAGRLYQPAKWEPHTCAKDGGYLPTPCARDYRSPGVSRSRKANIEDRRGIPLSVWFREEFGRRLHATFVEWMMGYPLKHTVLEPWAMQWFRSKREKRSKN